MAVMMALMMDLICISYGFNGSCNFRYIVGRCGEAELAGVHHRRIEMCLAFLQFRYDVRRRSKKHGQVDSRSTTGTTPTVCIYWESHQNLTPILFQVSPTPIFSHKSKQHVQDHLQTQGVRIVHQFPQQLLENP